jgi:hypothetical protein
MGTLRFNILSTENSGLGVGEDGSDLEASRALDIEEVAVWRLNQSLKLVSVLLVLSGWVKQIDLHYFQKRNAKKRIIINTNQRVS